MSSHWAPVRTVLSCSVAHIILSNRRDLLHCPIGLFCPSVQKFCCSLECILFNQEGFLDLWEVVNSFYYKVPSWSPTWGLRTPSGVMEPSVSVFQFSVFSWPAARAQGLLMFTTVSPALNKHYLELNDWRGFC